MWHVERGVASVDVDSDELDDPPISTRLEQWWLADLRSALAADRITNNGQVRGTFHRSHERSVF